MVDTFAGLAGLTLCLASLVSACGDDTARSCDPRELIEIQSALTDLCQTKPRTMLPLRRNWRWRTLRPLLAQVGERPKKHRVTNERESLAVQLLDSGLWTGSTMSGLEGLETTLGQAYFKPRPVVLAIGKNVKLTKVVRLLDTLRYYNHRDVAFVLDFTAASPKTLDSLPGFLDRMEVYRAVHAAFLENTDVPNHPIRAFYELDSQIVRRSCPAWDEVVETQRKAALWLTRADKQIDSFAEAMRACDCNAHLGVVAALLAMECEAPMGRGEPMTVPVRLVRNGARRLVVGADDDSWGDIADKVGRWSHSDFWLEGVKPLPKALPEKPF